MDGSRSTRDTGKSWTERDGALPGLPEWATIKMIEPSPFDAAVAYVIVDAHMIDDMHPYLYRTGDYGKTCTLISDRFLRTSRSTSLGSTREVKGTLYAGTDVGVPAAMTARPGVAPAQPADGPGSRPEGQGRRPRPGHSRPILRILDQPDADPDIRSVVTAKPVDVLPPAPATRWRTTARSAPLRRPTIHPRGSCSIYWLRDTPKARPKLRDSRCRRQAGAFAGAKRTARSRQPSGERREPGKESTGEEQEAKEKAEEADEHGSAGGPGKAKLPTSRAFTGSSGTWNMTRRSRSRTRRSTAATPKPAPWPFPASTRRG